MRNKKIASGIAAIAILTGCTDRLFDGFPKSENLGIEQEYSIEERVVELGLNLPHGFAHNFNGFDVGNGFLVVPSHGLDAVMGVRRDEKNQAGATQKSPDGIADYATSMKSMSILYPDGKIYGIDLNYGPCKETGDLTLIRAKDSHKPYINLQISTPWDSEQVTMISRQNGRIKKIDGEVTGKLSEGSFNKYTVNDIIVTNIAEPPGFSGGPLTDREESKVYGIGIYGSIDGALLKDIKFVSMKNVTRLLQKCFGQDYKFN